MKLVRMTDEGYETMLNDLPENILNYVNENNGNWIKDKHGNSGFFKEINLEFEAPELISSDSSQKAMLHNIREMYQKLSLTPDQAGDFQIWAALTHSSEFYSYCRKSIFNEFDSMDLGGKLNTIRNGYFQRTKGARRALISNRLSRLWWTGYLCDTKFGDFETNLELFTRFGTASMINDLLNNRTYINSPRVLQGIFDGIQKYALTGKELIGRTHIRPALNQLSLSSGGILIDYLSQEEIGDRFYQLLLDVNQSNEIDWHDEEDNGEELRISDDE